MRTTASAVSASLQERCLDPKQLLLKAVALETQFPSLTYMPLKEARIRFDSLRFA